MEHHKTLQPFKTALGLKFPNPTMARGSRQTQAKFARAQVEVCDAALTKPNPPEITKAIQALKAEWVKLAGDPPFDLYGFMAKRGLIAPGRASEVNGDIAREQSKAFMAALKEKIPDAPRRKLIAMGRAWKEIAIRYSLDFSREERAGRPAAYLAKKAEKAAKSQAIRNAARGKKS